MVWKVDGSSLRSVPETSLTDHDLVDVEERGTHQRVKIELRENVDFESKQFKDFLRECFESFQKVVS